LIDFSVFSKRPYFLKSLTIGTALLLSACAAQPESRRPAKTGPAITPISFAQLPGWQEDNQRAALNTFLKSCNRIIRLAPNYKMPPFQIAGYAGHWQDACHAAVGAGENAASARQYFEAWFRPYAITNGGAANGLFTGYFEPELNGSLRRSTRFTVPLYQKPPDLVSADLGRFDGELQGRSISGRLSGNRLVPYAGRGEIEKGALAGKQLELLWVEDPIEAFFLHIQGSGRVVLESGDVIRVGFDGKNGRPYHAIGHDLVAMGAIPEEQMSLQAIRRWLQANPAQAQAVMNRNASYVFFRRIIGPGPVGAEGVPLTPGRSLAIDRKHLPLSAPLWLDTVHPLSPASPLRRLVVAQDTGGAITGPVRGDLFWGAGAQAREAAGHMKSPGRLYILLPKVIQPRPLG